MMATGKCIELARLKPRKRILPRMIEERGIKFFIFPDGMVYASNGRGWRKLGIDRRVTWKA